MRTPRNIRIDGWEIFKDGRKWYAVKQHTGLNYHTGAEPTYTARSRDAVYTATSRIDGHSDFRGTLKEMKYEAGQGRLVGFWTKREAIEHTQAVS